MAYTQDPVPSPQINAYGDNPWSDITESARNYYDPYLIQTYRKFSAYRPFTSYSYYMGDKRAKAAVFTELLPSHPNIDRIPERELWTRSSRVDSRTKAITFQHYGGKFSYHKYDPLMMQWRMGEKYDVIRTLSMTTLGQNMSDVMDILSRNALLSVPFKHYPNSDVHDDTGIGTVQEDTVLTPETINSIHLGMTYRGVGYVNNGTNFGADGTIVCITTPSVIADLRSQITSVGNGWLMPTAYTRPDLIYKYEMGTYNNVRFVSTTGNVLWNCGEIYGQVAVSEPIKAGDGASPELVDNTYEVGQDSATHWIQLAATDVLGATVNAAYIQQNFPLNQMLSIHKRRTNAYGVTNGVDYQEGTLHNLRVVYHDLVNRRIGFNLPVLEDFTTELTSGVYAYVTAGRHVHASIFIGANDAVIAAVADAPQIHTPPAFDDFMSMHRFVWEARMGYNLWNPNSAEVVFSTGPVRFAGGELRR